uniref:G-protein coupled receptors family 1 profile domain-containing protein n=1 Tax=Mola mola TaxID=94237 RepID=A0A3Q3XEB2_MOLML
MSPWDTSACILYLGLYMAAYVIAFVLGFPGNILAFYTFCKKVRQKPTPIDILLLNLTISDLLFLFFLPFKMHEVANNMFWNLPYGFCKLSIFIFYMTIYNSTFVLTAVSVERYLGVAFPIQHALKRRPVYAVAASIFFWIDSLNSTSVCYENFSQSELNIILPVRLQICVVLFCIPFLICIYCYVNFIRILSKLQHIDQHRRMRAMGMALGTLIVFAICFGPYNVSHIVGFVTGENPRWRNQALILSTFNACLDPFIFYMSSSAVRGNVGRVMKGVKNHLNRCLSCHMFWASWRGINNSEKDKEHKQQVINTI